MVATAVVVALGGFSIVRVFGGGGDDPVNPTPSPTAVASADPTEGPTDAPTEPSTPPTEEPTEQGPAVPIGNEQETPDSINVEGLVQAEVGEWRLVDAAELPEWIELGASSALRTQYKNPQNFNVRHIVAAFSNDASAQETALAFADAIKEEEDQKLLEEFPVVIDEEEVGTGYFFARNGGHLVLYTNGPILSTVAAARRANVIDFYANVPY